MPVSTLDRAESEISARTRRPGATGSGVDALNPRTERAQPLVDPLVAPVDLRDVADGRRAFGAEARDEHRHPGSDVRALQALAVELRRPGDDDAMRVADDDAGAHADELVHEEQAVLEHLLEEEDRPLRLGGNNNRDRREIGRERRPDAVLDLRDLPAEVVLDDEVLPRGHVHRVSSQLDPHAEALEG